MLSRPSTLAARLSWVPLIIAALAITACGDREEVYLDLLAEETHRRVLPAAVVLDPDRLHASSSGWWKVENPENGPSFVWARAKEVALSVELAGGASAELSFRCWPYAWNDGPPQTVEAVLNGTSVGSVELGPTAGDHAFDLPEELVARGANHLELIFAHAARPSDHEQDSNDRRTLAAAFEWLAIGSKAPAGERLADGSASSADGLLVTAGSAVATTARLGAVRMLDLEAEATSAGAHAEVWVQTPGAAPEVVLSEPLGAGSRGRWQVDLSPFAGRPATIGLAAAMTTGGVRWTKARVSGPPGDEQRPANVIMIAVDTLRADYLSAYGGPAKSPHIDGLAAEGALFARAYSHIPITGPSHSSIFTAKLPTEHGVQNNSQVLAADHVTLAETLKEAGYSTAAFVSLGVLNGRFGFDQGFDHYDDHFQGDWMKNAEQINRAVLPWLDGQGDDPFFLWVHYSDPHEPYTPPNRSYPGIRVMVDGTEVGRLEADGRSREIEFVVMPGTTTVHLVAEDPTADVRYRFPYLNLAGSDFELEFADGWALREKRFGAPVHDTLLPATIEVGNSADRARTTKLQLTCKERLTVAQIKERYVSEIEYLDEVMGRLLEALDERGDLDNSLVIFVADHGEGLGDHNHVGHISQVYDSLIHVPLILRFPERIAAGRVVEQRVGLVDLFPTVLDAIGVPGSEDLGGGSLLPMVEGLGPDRPVVAVTFKPEAASDKEALILGGYKYIRSTSDHEWEELYDLNQDPEESVDLKASHQDELLWLRGELDAVLASTGDAVGAAQADLSEEDRARLRELGYIH